MAGIARNLCPAYVFPDRHIISGPLLDVLFDTSYKQQMNTLLLECTIFGNSLLAGCATFGKSSSYWHFATALLAIWDFTAQMQCGGKKYAEYIAKLILPEIQKMEDKAREHNKKHPGVVNLVYFDRVSNVQKAGDILKVNFLALLCVMVRGMLLLFSFQMIWTR